MKTKNVIWISLLAVLFTQSAMAGDTSGTKVKGVEVKGAEVKIDSLPKADIPGALSPTVTRYDISLNPKMIKDKDALANLGAKLEGSETFKASECSRTDMKKSGYALSYSCAKINPKTDELFRAPAAKPGVITKTVTYAAAVEDCPTGCKWSATCTADTFVTCCKIALPKKYCTGYPK